MIEPRLFLCSGADPSVVRDDGMARRTIVLDALGSDQNVHINITDVARLLATNVPPRLVDLLEIASYVYTADAGTQRGTAWDAETVEPWSRDFRFVIPVRDGPFWARTEVVALLKQALTFLSNDAYTFDFIPLEADRSIQEYLELGHASSPFEKPERVVMFSGGLDSLAGAAQTASAGSPLVLVSHRPVGQLSARQKRLVKELQKTFGTVPILHVPVWINKANALGHEPTQRTRSFLFAALGMCVGQMVNADGVRFFENGVVSLNLPVADEVVRARSSRTTHPHALRLFTQLAVLLTERPFAIDNPFLMLTKADVISTIVSNGAGHLIAHSVSCAHTMFASKLRQHCGTCSQCIDRRIAMFAAGHSNLDPASDYASDVFTGARDVGYSRGMAIHYARHCRELRDMTAIQFVSRFSLDLTRAAKGMGNVSEAMTGLYDLHQRHAEGVNRVLSDQLTVNASLLVDGKLEPTSLLGLVADQQHKSSMWKAYAGRIGDILADGIPAACRTHPPKDEPHMQELAEGLLQPFDSALDREFPFVRWSGSTTKADFSSGQNDLWIELKYVRKKTDIRTVTEDIAADITKYGDSGLHVLFVVYDPKHLISNELLFAKEIVRRPAMLVRFIR